jgi:hypothetical protein
MPSGSVDGAGGGLAAGGWALGVWAKRVWGDHPIKTEASAAITKSTLIPALTWLLADAGLRPAEQAGVAVPTWTGDAVTDRGSKFLEEVIAFLT